jgi:hypothetical protein
MRHANSFAATPPPPSDRYGRWTFWAPYAFDTKTDPENYLEKKKKKKKKEEEEEELIPR